MILQALRDFGQSLGDARLPHFYQYRRVRWVIPLDAHGNIAGDFVKLEDTEDKRKDNWEKFKVGDKVIID